MFHGLVDGRRLAQEHAEGHVDGLVLEVRVPQDQAVLVRGPTDDSVGGVLPLTERREGGQVLFLDAEDVALLRLVAPDLHRAETRLRVGNGSE